MITLDLAIDTVMQLPSEQQEMLIGIIRQRHLENRRHEMARDARDALEAFHEGKLRPQPFADILVELRQVLEEDLKEFS